MYPELFHLGPIPIRSYGLMLALSFMASILYVQWIAKREDKPFEPFLALSYLFIIGGVVGARLFYVVLHLDEFAGNWTATFNPFATDSYGISGLNIYGGVLLALISAFAYCRIKKIPTLEMFDYFSPTMGIGLGLTRIGCFLNGCCFGTPTDLPWGVHFPQGSMPHWVYGDAHIHPSQLYSSLYGVVLFLLLHFMMKRKKFDGQLVAVLFMVEAVFRFGIEYVRYYESEMYFSVFGLEPTYNQLISVTLFLLGPGIYVVQKRRMRG